MCRKNQETKDLPLLHCEIANIHSMEHAFWSLRDYMGDALTGVGALNLLEWTVQPPLACYIVQDDPIVS